MTTIDDESQHENSDDNDDDDDDDDRPPYINPYRDIAPCIKEAKDLEEAKKIRAEGTVSEEDIFSFYRHIHGSSFIFANDVFDDEKSIETRAVKKFVERETRIFEPECYVVGRFESDEYDEDSNTTETYCDLIDLTWLDDSQMIRRNSVEYYWNYFDIGNFDGKISLKLSPHDPIVCRLFKTEILRDFCRSVEILFSREARHWPDEGDAKDISGFIECITIVFTEAVFKNIVIHDHGILKRVSPLCTNVPLDGLDQIVPQLKRDYEQLLMPRCSVVFEAQMSQLYSYRYLEDLDVHVLDFLQDFCPLLDYRWEFSIRQFLKKIAPDSHWICTDVKLIWRTSTGILTSTPIHCDHNSGDERCKCMYLNRRPPAPKQKKVKRPTAMWFVTDGWHNSAAHLLAVQPNGTARESEWKILRVSQPEIQYQFNKTGRLCRSSEYFYGAEQRFFRNSALIMEITLIFGEHLPPYVILEIIDWLPFMGNFKQFWKIRVIERVRESVRARREQQEKNKKIKP